MIYKSDNRVFAFCIVGDIVFRGEYHSECCEEASWFIEDTNSGCNNEKIVEDVDFIGEVYKLDNKEVVLVYTENMASEVKKRFNLPVYLLNSPFIQPLHTSIN